MPVFVGLMIFFFLALGLFFFFFWLWVAWSIYRWFQKRKQQRAHRLATYLRRLHPVVAELLHQVNELDQASKYSGLDQDARWAKKYQDALHKLLDASNRLEETNAALREQELVVAQEHLLYVIRTVHIVSYRMREMQPIEEIIELKAELKREQAKEAQMHHDEKPRAANANPSHASEPPHAPGTTQNTDEQAILKLNTKKKDILHDDLGKH